MRRYPTSNINGYKNYGDNQGGQSGGFYKDDRHYPNYSMREASGRPGYGNSLYHETEPQEEAFIPSIPENRYYQERPSFKHEVDLNSVPYPYSIHNTHPDRENPEMHSGLHHYNGNEYSLREEGRGPSSGYKGYNYPPMNYPGSGHGHRYPTAPNEMVYEGNSYNEEMLPSKGFIRSPQGNRSSSDSRPIPLGQLFGHSEKPGDIMREGEYYDINFHGGNALHSDMNSPMNDNDDYHFSSSRSPLPDGEYYSEYPYHSNSRSPRKDEWEYNDSLDPRAYHTWRNQEAYGYDNGRKKEYNPMKKSFGMRDPDGEEMDSAQQAYPNYYNKSNHYPQNRLGVYNRSNGMNDDYEDKERNYGYPERAGAYPFPSYPKNDGFQQSGHSMNTPYYYQPSAKANSSVYSTASYESPMNTDSSQLIVKGSSLYNVVKQYVDAAVQMKKEGNIVSARERLEELTKELEMEMGNIKQCCEVVLKGLQALPGNENLLEKRVKIEERLRHVDGVIECAQAFLDMNNSRCVKSIVEAAIVVAKLGYGYKASDLFQSLIHHNLCTQGGVTLDYIRFVFKTEDYFKGLDMLKETLTKLTKHGPMWFFTFSVLEQHHTVLWIRGDIKSRPYNQELSYHLDTALSCLSDDLKWKVYYIAAQAQLRSFTHIRLWTRLKKRNMPDYCKHYPEVIRICFDYLKKCVLLCPDTYKWKVWLLAGRVQALAGKRQSAIKCLVRSTEIAPERSTHAVCLELARILDFIGDPTTAGNVICKNITHFPEEWKLVLERIHQLLRENRFMEAYELNKNSIQHHLGAGRLWSSVIQLTHQLYGPTAALHTFICALLYVSKSGEVWCEGARIYMNPIGSHFNPLNAQRCLNFAVYFTPQYGDSFIEALRLSMILSEELLQFARSNNPCFLSASLTARDYRPIINKCVYSDPNYGSCWFRAKLFPLGSAEEVIFRAIKFTAHEVALVANVYYDALLDYARRVRYEKKNTRLSASSTPYIPKSLRPYPEENNDTEMTKDTYYKRSNKLSIRNSLFSYSFEPYQMITMPKPITIGKKLKILFGTSQIEA